MDNNNIGNEMKQSWWQKQAPVVSEFLHIHATLQTTFQASVTGDEQISYISGATFLPDQTVVLADMKNLKIKVYDKDYRYLCDMKFTSPPCDVTPTGVFGEENEFAVSFPHKRNVQLFSVINNIVQKKTEINFGDYGISGISFSQEKMAVVCPASFPPASVRIVSRDGTEISCITRDEKGEDIFSCPDYVAMDQSGRTLYVTDINKKSVICVTMDGQKLWEFSLGNHKPRGLAMCGENILVAVWQDHKVIQLTKDGKIMNEVIVGEINWPWKICTSTDNKQMIVTQFKAVAKNIDTNTVRVYTLS